MAEPVLRHAAAPLGIEDHITVVVLCMLYVHDAVHAGLINNAGVQTVSDATTPDGLEVTLGVNFYGPMYLTQLLIPTLQQAARGPHSSTRIVWNASPEETLGETLWDDLK
jgi:NAD(P)-dependent dehydrogenase (short-subunit alcohol dehydrogenase family)